MNSYFTGLIAQEPEIKAVRVPRSSGWHVTFSRVRKNQMQTKGLEVVIKAKSWATAQRALNLIVHSLALYSGGPSSLDQDLIAHNDAEPHDLRGSLRRLRTSTFWSTVGIPHACAIAARASRSKRLVYAITKYNFSVGLYSVFVVDLEPFSSEHLPISPFPTDHVTFSYAIVAAYSVLEDLGLELRASQEKPSRINGKWNPPVRLDLEARLTKSGVNLDETLLWTVRSSNRKIEEKRALPAHEKCPWSYGAVRDCKVLLVDAIAYAGWLRGRVASHAVKDLTKCLSPYDVINVQHLARRLILETLGLWEVLSRRD